MREHQVAFYSNSDLLETLAYPNVTMTDLLFLFGERLAPRLTQNLTRTHRRQNKTTIATQEGTRIANPTTLTGANRAK